METTRNITQAARAVLLLACGFACTKPKTALPDAASRGDGAMSLAARAPGPSLEGTGVAIVPGAFTWRDASRPVAIFRVAVLSRETQAPLTGATLRVQGEGEGAVVRVSATQTLAGQYLAAVVVRKDAPALRGARLTLRVEAPGRRTAVTDLAWEKPLPDADVETPVALALAGSDEEEGDGGAGDPGATDAWDKIVGTLRFVDGGENPMRRAFLTTSDQDEIAVGFASQGLHKEMLGKVAGRPGTVLYGTWQKGSPVPGASTGKGAAQDYFIVERYETPPLGAPLP